MNPHAATLTPPPRVARVVVNPVRRGAWLAGGALVILLAVNLPAFLRTALDCDPILFDLFLRDMGRGRVLYRDMLENNTPAMIALHAAVRWAFGWSSEALRAVDVVVVGAGVWLLAGWFHRDRLDRRLFTACVLGSLYLSTTEWCHCQRDVWVLLPVMGAMLLRRAAVVGGRRDLTPRPPLRSGEGVSKMGDAIRGFESPPGIAPDSTHLDHPLSASERGPGGEVTPARGCRP